MSLGATTAAQASQGCDAANNGFLDSIVSIGPGGGSGSSQFTYLFEIGDKVTFVITIAGDGEWTLKNNALTATLVPTVTASTTFTYTISGTNGDTRLGSTDHFVILGGTLTVAATCVPAASQTTSTNTDSAKVRAVQVVGSQIVAQNSGAAVDQAVGGAIDGVFGNAPMFSGGAGNIALNFTGEPRPEVTRRVDHAFAALGYASPAKAAAHHAPVHKPAAWQPWSLWARVQGTGFDRGGSSALDGHQVNVTGGLGYRVTPNLLLGAFAGYENFNYDITALTGSFGGHGVTFGGYFAWRFTQNLRWDAAVAHSWLDYDASAGTASGSFDASRWFLSTGLTGTFRAGPFLIEPSAKLFALWEDQDAWTDSLATQQAARSFSAGRASFGSRIARQWQMTDGITVTPSLGLYGDWRFSSDDALPAGTPMVGFSDDWSARVTAGLGIASRNGCSVALAADYGGIGTDYKIWTGSARLSVPF